MLGSPLRHLPLILRCLPDSPVPPHPQGPLPVDSSQPAKVCAPERSGGAARVPGCAARGAAGARWASGYLERAGASVQHQSRRSSSSSSRLASRANSAPPGRILNHRRGRRHRRCCPGEAQPGRPRLAAPAAAAAAAAAAATHTSSVQGGAEGRRGRAPRTRTLRRHRPCPPGVCGRRWQPRPSSPPAPAQPGSLSAPGDRLAVKRRPARLLFSRRRSELLRALVAAAAAAAAAAASAAAARGHLKVGAWELDASLIGLQLLCSLTCPRAVARSSPKPTQPTGLTAPGSAPLRRRAAFPRGRRGDRKGPTSKTLQTV